MRLKTEMKCEKCQEWLSDFLDGELNDKDHTSVSMHLEICSICANVHNDFTSILNTCSEYKEHYIAPPNEHALWLRISNTIESELNGNWSHSTAAINSSDKWWSRLLNKRWELSLPQLGAAVATVAVAVSIGTISGLRFIDNKMSASNDAQMSIQRHQANNHETIINQRQLDINYWQQRVEQRKAYWKPQMREAFDRNMQVVDQTVNDALNELNRNPHDEISEEMFNDALNHKMELLRKFSDL
jgi:hypothetical protein